MNSIKKYQNKFFKICILFSLLIFTTCTDQERVVNTTKPQFVISLAEISTGPYYSDSCLDCSDISEIKFQVSLSENGEPLGNKQIDFTTSAIDGLFPYNHVTFESNKTSNNGTLLFTFDDKGQYGSIELTVSISESDTTVSTSTIIEIEPYYTLVDQLTSWLTESSVVAGDTTSAVTYYAQVKDTNNASLPNIPIQFRNLSATGTLYSSDPTLNPDDPIYTNSLGKASLNFKVESTNFSDSSVPLTAEIANLSQEDTMLETAYVSVLSDNSDRVDLLEVWVIAEEQIVDNINVTVIDTIFARALTSQGQAVSNVAVQFTKETEGFGYISEASVLTDEYGLAKTIYYPYTQLNPNEVAVQEVLFNVSIGGQGLNEEFTIGLDMSGNTNIEYDVSEFSFYPDYDFTTHILGNESEFSVIVKDGSGVGVSNVPVRFSIVGEGSSTSNGVLSTSIGYTCCSESSSNDGSDNQTEEGDTGGGDTNDDNSMNTGTETQQSGTAKVKYYNINGGTDILRGYIVDPLNAADELHFDDLEIRTNTVSELNAYAKYTDIYVNTLDSLFCDSVFVKAVDTNLNTLEDIQIYYAIDNTDVGGYINVYEDNTTNQSRTSTALFCPDPAEFGSVSIIVSTNITGVSDTVNITYYNDLPECQNCTAELKLVADQYILPYVDGDESIPTSLITATMKDSLGYDPDVNTLIHFDAIQEDDNGDWVDVGSITEFGYFTDPADDGASTELKAFTTFDMFDASGIVTVIGTSQGLSDTIYISIVSTEPSFIEMVPPYPNELMVQGGGGIESTNLEVEIKDGDGNPVTEPNWVVYTILGAPTGTHLNGNPDLSESQPFAVLSSNGVSTVPVNAGTRPGSVQMKVELYATEDDGTMSDEIIATSQGTPITIATGSPAQGVINYSYVDITTIGGGLYQIPVSVDLWDVHSNPVADSTNVYFSVRGVATPYDEAAEYYNGDKIFWSPAQTNHGSEITDSLVYECKAPVNLATPALSFACQNATLAANTPNSEGGGFLWESLSHPANIEGVAKTANENFDGESYPGKAWTYLYFSSSTIFDETILFAQTYSSGGDELIIDSRANHDGGALDLPLTADGTVSVGANPTAHDFTTGGSHVNVGVSGSIIDYYQYPIDNGQLFLNAPFSTILNACNAIDANGNGFTGFCCLDGNLDGDCQDTGDETDVLQNHFTCSDCGDNDFTWEFDDCGTDGDCAVVDADGTQADGIQDDNPSIGISNKDGSVSWTVQYPIGINICDCTDGNEVCEDRESNISVSLLNPLQATSDPVQVILSETDPTATPDNTLGLFPAPTGSCE
jgi:hypothetical protein